MPTDKKTFWPLIFLLLLLLASCGVDTNTQLPKAIGGATINFDAAKQEPVVNENDNYTDINDDYIPPESESHEDASVNETRVVINPMANFTSTWAKTDTHFFFTSSAGLHRLPLEDILQGEIITVPSIGTIEIVGINELYLFVSASPRSHIELEDWHFNTYRISHTTLEATLIDSGPYFIAPSFHPPSNSLLFAHRNLDERLILFESLHLDTGLRNVISAFDGNAFFPHTSWWWQMENGDAVFANCTAGGIGDGGKDYFLIDSDFQARQLWPNDIEWTSTWEDRWQDPAGVFLRGLGIFPWEYVMIYDWVYYLVDINDWGGHSRFLGNLHRININGTQGTILQESVSMSSLREVNNQLFATVYARQEGDIDAPWHEAVILSHDGAIVKVLGGGWDGHNSVFRMERLVDTDVVMLMQNGWVIGVYCTVTGALFSLG